MYVALPFCGFEFSLGFRGLFCSVPGLGAVWLEVEAVRGGKFLIVEKHAAHLEAWAGRLHLVADRQHR